MPPIIISLSELQKQIESQAYIYGIPTAVGTLLGEFVTDFILERAPARVPKI